MRHLKRTFLVFLFFASLYCHGQKSLIDSSYLLKEVEVSGRLQNFSTGNKVETFDSISFKNNSINTLAQLLSSESQIFVKTYGLGTLATPSFRGTNAEHTAVLWNGFNLSSPSNGQLDFSLVPVSFIDDLKVQSGGSGALWGSGAIGGSVHINNTAEFDKGLTLNAGLNYGSFEDKQQHLEFSKSNKKFITTTHVFNHEAKNNFPFTNISQLGKPIQRLINAELRQYGLLQENYFKIAKNQQLSFRFWYQNNDRNIPPTMTEGVSKANQKDEFYRAALEWQLNKEKISVFVRSAYFDEYINFTKPSISLNSNNHTKSYIIESETKIKLSDIHSFNFGINNTHNLAFAKDYIRNPEQNRVAFFGSYRITNKTQNLSATTSVRQEFISKGADPFTASAGFEAWIIRKFRLRGNLSKTYRVPTFNELYWTPGGNPNLLPEQGFSQEFGLAFISSKKKINLKTEASLFSNKIDNWVIWVPDNSGFNWFSQNVLAVWSRGVEYDFQTGYNIQKVNLKLRVQYQYILPTVEKVYPGDESSLKKQLRYFPLEKAQCTISGEFKRFSVSFIYNYVGYRYTTADNRQFLQPYDLVNLYLSKEFILKKVNIKSSFRINNIRNESYQVIAYTPMPGRSYQLGLTFKFNKPNQK